MTSHPARILLVDDSAFMRRAAARMLEPMGPGVCIAGTAANGVEAVERVRELRPDLVIMDVEMPEVGGLEALRRIMDEFPTPVLLLSSHTREGAEVTLRALEAGAVDFVDKSGAATAMDIHSLAPLLRDKVAAILASRGELHPATGDGKARRTRFARTDVSSVEAGDYEIVAIGASTGGPRALAEVIPALPAGLTAGVVVAQHMPAGFTETLAERLDRRARLRVREGRDGDEVHPGLVLIAPGGRQMSVERDGALLRIRVWDDDTCLHRPSVDTLFDSVARAAPGRAVGVILTGMGSDGTEGLRKIREGGGRALVESAETAVIDGMPGAAREIAERSLPLPAIAAAVAELCGGGR